MQVPQTLSRLPFIGRVKELHELRSALEQARLGSPTVGLLTGDGGVGKSRLAAVIAEEARRGGWTVALGRAYPVESGVPYAVVSDAFVPLLRDLGAAGLTVLARGSESQLAHLFPALRAVAASAGRGADAVPAANRAELFWTFAEFLRNLASRAPVLVVLEDLHWADPSSIELFHFLARQLADQPIVMLGTVNDAERDAHPTLRATMKSLESLPVVMQRRIEPFTHEGTAELVRQAFGIDQAVTRDFTALLFGWTRGNPFFVEETLKALVASGQLRNDGGGWLGWELDRLELPTSVREAIELRLAALSDDARDVAELAAVIGARAGYTTIRTVSGLSHDRLVEALDQLRLLNLLDEAGTPREPVYEFRHPMLGQTLYARVGLARRRLLHSRIAESLEDAYGADALEHADELAYHFMAGENDSPSPRAARYLAAAGRSALARFANREAADYLEAALARVDPADERALRDHVVNDLARACQRLGNFERAIALRTGLRDAARARDDHAAAATLSRRIGVAHFWAGRHGEAIRAYDEGLAEAERAGETVIAAHIRLARGAVLDAIGRVPDALADLRAALDGAERGHDVPLQARAHRELLLFHTMAGPPDLARHHGERAILLAEASEDPAAAGTCHWAMSVLEALSGNAQACALHMQRATELAEEINSPLLRLAIDEVHIGWAYGLGAWDTGLALGERAIALARSLNQRQMLPRLLVWTALIYLGRYEIERAKAYIDEAWQLSGADDLSRVRDIHTVVPAHIGRAHYHMTLWEWDEAIRFGQAGLALADASGYRTWAVHRLLPTIVEAQLSKFDATAARETSIRMRSDAAALDNVLGLAWADAADAILRFVEGDPVAAAPLMRAALEKLEAVPYIPSAARLRRHLAGRLAQIGERDAAISELRRAHDIFVRLGAQWELDRTRAQFQDLGARPPGRSAGQGVESLTSRELEIVRLVAASKSNKAIGKALDISPRTVSTHLSNIYTKLEIGTRAELAEMAPVILSG